MSEATQEIIINTVMFAVALLMICWIFYIIRHGKAESKLDELLGTEWQVIQWADLKHNDRVRVYFTKGPIEFDAKWDNEHINPTYEMFLVKPGDNLYGGKNYFPINEVRLHRFNDRALNTIKIRRSF